MNALLLISIVTLFTTNTLAAESTDSNDGRGIPLATGVVSAVVGASSIPLNQLADRQEDLVEKQSIAIKDAEIRLQHLEAERARIETINPDEFTNQRYSLNHSIPEIGSNPPHTVFYQEYITDPTLAARAQRALEQIQDRVGDAKDEYALERIRHVSESTATHDLVEQYDSIIREAQEKGLIKSRRADYLNIEFSDITANERLTNNLLEFESYRQRGFMNKDGITGKSNEFVLRITKQYNVAGVKEAKAKQLLHLAELAQNLQGDKENFAQKKSQLEKSVTKNRKSAKVTKWTGIAGGVGSIALGWMMTTSSSSEAELFEQTNPTNLNTDNVAQQANQ